MFMDIDMDVADNYRFSADRKWKTEYTGAGRNITNADNTCRRCAHSA